jgi:hypothetical protein
MTGKADILLAALAAVFCVLIVYLPPGRRARRKGGFPRTGRRKRK